MVFRQGTNSNYMFPGETSNTERQPEQRKWEVEWLKEAADSQWISQGVVTLYPRKGKTFPGQTSKVLVWPREQNAECSEGGKSWRETAEEGRSSNMEARAICQHSSAHTVSERKGLQKAKSPSLSLWFLSVFLLSLLGTSSITCTSHPPKPHTHTHTHSYSSSFLLICGEACRLEEEGQEDEVAWEGLSPNRSICFLVCPPGWLLAPAQLLHSLQPNAKHQHVHTTGLHPSKSQCWQVWEFFKRFLYIYIYIKRERFSRWPSTRYSCPGRKMWPVNLNEHLTISLAF